MARAFHEGQNLDILFGGTRRFLASNNLARLFELLCYVIDGTRIPPPHVSVRET
jgi:hypothetical protein